METVIEARFKLMTMDLTEDQILFYKTNFKEKFSVMDYIIYYQKLSIDLLKSLVNESISTGNNLSMYSLFNSITYSQILTKDFIEDYLHIYLNNLNLIEVLFKYQKNIDEFKDIIINSIYSETAKNGLNNILKQNTFKLSRLNNTNYLRVYCILEEVNSIYQQYRRNNRLIENNLNFIIETNKLRDYTAPTSMINSNLYEVIVDENKMRTNLIFKKSNAIMINQIKNIYKRP